MNNIKLIDDTPDLASVAAINSILTKYQDDIGQGDANYASSKQVKEVEAQKITFYFGDQVIGEVKFLKAGTKADKIDRCKKMLIKKETENDRASLIGRMLYSQFCNFKIN